MTATANPSVTTAFFRNEARLLGREPASLIFAILLPFVAIVVMSAIPAAREPNVAFGGRSVVHAYLPVLVLFSQTIIGMVVIPSILGSYREMGVLRRLRTTPASPVHMLLAVFLLALVVGVGMSALLTVVPVFFGAGLPEHLLTYSLTALLGLLSFVAIGTVLCAVIPNSRAAGGVGNVVAAVNWFFAGLWVPRAIFPQWLVDVSNWFPGGAVAQGMESAIAGTALGWQPPVVLLGWTLVMVAIAAKTFRWE